LIYENFYDMVLAMTDTDYTNPVAAQFAAMAVYVPPLVPHGENGAPNTERSVEGISGASADANARHPKQGAGQSGSGREDRRDTFRRSAATAETDVLLLTPPHSRPGNPPGVGRTLDVYG
jgi:hypothetical protein